MTDIIFGSMRMSEKSHSIQYWVNLFKYMHDRGINEHHVSIEYESFELYVSVFKVFKTEYPNCKITHICKVGEPSFDDKKFSRNRLVEKCKEYCIKLNVKTINIQWMSRQFLTDHTQRRRHLSEVSHEFSKTIKELQKAAIVDRYSIFPYSENDLQFYLEEEQYSPDNYITYFNLIEKEYESILSNFNSNNNIAIRPLMAKKVLDQYTLNEAINQINNSGVFNSCIISVSNKKQIDEIISCIH